MRTLNEIRFKLVNPFKGEAWADKGSGIKAVGIIIDGQDILDIIMSIEMPYMRKERLNRPKEYDYRHIQLEYLYGQLKEATIVGSYSNQYGVYLCCCGMCGEPGCWNVTAMVKEENDCIVWYDFRHEHRNWKYDLRCIFEKAQYEKALKEMEHLSDKI